MNVTTKNLDFAWNNLSDRRKNELITTKILDWDLAENEKGEMCWWIGDDKDIFDCYEKNWNPIKRMENAKVIRNYIKNNFYLLNKNIEERTNKEVLEAEKMCFVMLEEYLMFLEKN